MTSQHDELLLPARRSSHLESDCAGERTCARASLPSFFVRVLEYRVIILVCVSAATSPAAPPPDVSVQSP